jgi:hypothetical protein
MGEVQFYSKRLKLNGKKHRDGSVSFEDGTEYLPDELSALAGSSDSEVIAIHKIKKTIDSKIIGRFKIERIGRYD